MKITATKRTALSPWRCDFCHRLIAAGATYMHAAGYTMGEWVNIRLHEPCHTTFNLVMPDAGDTPFQGDFDHAEYQAMFERTGQWEAAKAYFLPQCEACDAPLPPTETDYLCRPCREATAARTAPRPLP